MKPRQLEKYLRSVTGQSMLSPKLRHWESEGLLGKVERVGVGKQRYYSKVNIDRAVAIAILRIAGWGLDSIKEGLTNPESMLKDDMIRFCNDCEFKMLPELKALLVRWDGLMLKGEELKGE